MPGASAGRTGSPPPTGRPTAGRPVMPSAAESEVQQEDSHGYRDTAQAHRVRQFRPVRDQGLPAPGPRQPDAAERDPRPRLASIPDPGGRGRVQLQPDAAPRRYRLPDARPG